MISSTAPHTARLSRRPVASSDDPSHDAKLLRIAEAAIRLAALGPRLADLATRVKEQAAQQAASAHGVAQTTARLAHDLELAVGELRASAGQVGDALDTVDRIADQTRMLAINAAIEAARAGEQGRAFSVIVNQVQGLSNQTADTTRLIETRVDGMRTNITRVAAVAGSGAAARDDAPTVTVVNRRVHHMAEAAQRQLAEADSIHKAGADINAHTEDLLLSLGAFRFRVHKRAAADLEALAPDLRFHLRDRYRLESSLKAWMLEHDHFEVAYVTDAAGRQITDNFARTDGAVTRDRASFGRDWSDRPWFLEAANQEGVRATNIYRSQATGGYCFTVSCGLRNEHGVLLGIVGADVNVQKILQT